MTALTDINLRWVSGAQNLVPHKEHCDMLTLDDVLHGISDSEALVTTEQDN